MGLESCKPSVVGFFFMFYKYLCKDTADEGIKVLSNQVI